MHSLSFSIEKKCSLTIPFNRSLAISLNLASAGSCDIAALCMTTGSFGSYSLCKFRLFTGVGGGDSVVVVLVVVVVDAVVVDEDAYAADLAIANAANSCWEPNAI